MVRDNEGEQEARVALGHVRFRPTSHEESLDEARALLGTVDSWLRKQRWHRREGGWRKTGDTSTSVSIGQALDQALDDLGVGAEPDFWDSRT